VNSDGLLFHKEDNQGNPGALAACREARDVALKRYRLCFNTKNVYADLDTDVLFCDGSSNLVTLL
jgi:hypothetical protein